MYDFKVNKHYRGIESFTAFSVATSEGDHQYFNSFGICFAVYGKSKVYFFLKPKAPTKGELSEKQQQQKNQ